MRSTRIILFALLIINAAGAFTGGYQMMSDPSGAGLGMNRELLINSPFRDFFYPGLILFVCNGLLSCLAVFSLSGEKRWAPSLIIAQGIVLGGWLCVELGMIRQFHYFQLIFFVIALLFIFLGNRLRSFMESDSI